MPVLHPDQAFDSHERRLAVVLGASTVALAVFGAVGAALGGANMLRGAIRVIFGGVLAMLVRLHFLSEIHSTPNYSFPSLWRCAAQPHPCPRACSPLAGALPLS